MPPVGQIGVQKIRGQLSLVDRSRRPRRSPAQTPPGIEAEVVGVRVAHPCWGARKIRRRLKMRGVDGVPAVSTVNEILRRHSLLDPAEADRHTAFKRFEHAQANDLWQMDFKGHFPLSATGRCHPLTVLDDHSRFALCLAACADEQSQTVRQRLTAIFERYGLPERMTMDNGMPWGEGPSSRYTALTVWLMRLGIRVSHSRPYHPQTQGKDERFHRTLKAEVLQGRSFADLPTCQSAFDRWRSVYNLERPHQALDLDVPASRYRSSRRAYPGLAPEPVYAPDDHLRRVQQGGWVHFKGHTWKLSKAFIGQRIALRPTTTDGLWDVVFVAQRVAQVDLRSSSGTSQHVTHVPEHL